MGQKSALRAREKRRARRAAEQPQGATGNDPTMDLDISDQKDDERRRNTSSEDEGDEDDEDNHGQLTTTGPPIDPNVADLVDRASQKIGHSGADGTAMMPKAIAAANTPSPSEALALLAASSAVANMGVEDARSLAAHGVTMSNLANEGLRNSDVTYDNRFKRYDEELKRYDEELQRMKDRDEQLQNRVALLEGLLSRVLSMMRNGAIDAAEIAQMLQGLGI